MGVHVAPVGRAHRSTCICCPFGMRQVRNFFTTIRKDCRLSASSLIDKPCSWLVCLHGLVSWQCGAAPAN